MKPIHQAKLKVCTFVFKNSLSNFSPIFNYSKTCLKWPLSKRPKIGFQDQLLLNAGQKYCRTLQGEHSAILPTFIKLPFVIKIFVWSIFEWPFYTGFTVILVHMYKETVLILMRCILWHLVWVYSVNVCV